MNNKKWEEVGRKSGDYLSVFSKKPSMLKVKSMNCLKHFVIAALLGVILVAPVALGAADEKAEKTKPYPLKTCVVSDEKLGEMGKPYVFTQDGREIHPPRPLQVQRLPQAVHRHDGHRHGTLACPVVQMGACGSTNGIEQEGL